MIQCKKCDVNIPKARSEMGYDVCVSCSTEQKKVGHVIYPHKTGAFIQVMDRETRDNLDRLDRRGITSKTSRHYKTIVKKKSKDLDKTAKVVRNRTSSSDSIIHTPYDTALKQRAEIQDLVVKRCLEPSPRALQRKFN